MDDWYARAVFFVSDGERSLHFYTEKLGFKVDWKFEYEGRADVFQVKLHGFALILNQGYAETETRVGQGRVFIGLDDGEQTESLRRHIEERAIETTVEHWGKPARVIRDPDGNELFFWPSLTEADADWRDRSPE